MKIVIECNTLEELREAVETIYIMFPDRAEGKPEKKERKRPSDIDRDEIERLVNEGYSNKDIAEILDIAYSTACREAKKIREKK